MFKPREICSSIQRNGAFYLVALLLQLQGEIQYLALDPAYLVGDIFSLLCCIQHIFWATPCVVHIPTLDSCLLYHKTICEHLLKLHTRPGLCRLVSKNTHLFKSPQLPSNVIGCAVLLQLQLIHKPPDICNNPPPPPAPSISYYKLFACTGVALRGWGVSNRCSCLCSLSIFYFFLLSWRALWAVWANRLFVYLFQMANHGGRFVSTLRTSFLLLLTTHTPTHICIYRPVIYCM